MFDPLIRFGKRNQLISLAFSSTPHIFGKRSDNKRLSMIDFSSTPHIRFGKRAPSNTFSENYVTKYLPFNLAVSEMPLSGTNSFLAHYGENGPFVRYRRPNPVDEEDTMLRFGK